MPDVTFQLPTAAIDAVARGFALSSAVQRAIALAQPVPHEMAHTVTCSPETAYELLQWFRAAATAAQRDPGQRERAMICAGAMNIIRAALDV